MLNEYYLIKQSLPYLKPNLIKIYTPVNKIHLKTFLSFMTGTIEVYIYNNENNSRIDLTDEMGNRNFNIYDVSFEKINKQVHSFKGKYTKNQYFLIYTLVEDWRKNLPKFFMFGEVFTLNGVEWHGSELFSCNLKEHKRKNTYGNAYEIFISKKYEALNYKVILNGIKNSFNDGGIDIIAEKENNIALIQCKNWKLLNNYKINQKDLRAFVGDCYIYIKEHQLYNKKISFHFIVSHNNILTKNAKDFLKENSFIKFKCVPFEIT